MTEVTCSRCGCSLCREQRSQAANQDTTRALTKINDRLARIETTLDILRDRKINE